MLLLMQLMQQWPTQALGLSSKLACEIWDRASQWQHW